MKVVLRSVLLLPKQPFLRSATVSVLGSSPVCKPEFPFPRSAASTSTVSGSKVKVSEIEQTQLGFLNSSKTDIFLRLQTSMQPSGLSPRDKINLPLRLKASRDGVGLVQETIRTKENTPMSINKPDDSFREMRNRFLSFKKEKYLENLECYKELAQAQAPKFLVISCADSRVCPSYILGFQPGEAFIVRNVANFVPPFENGPCETNAALEFSVNDLQVENILVTGHSCCGGIRALMSMDDEEKSSFIKNWVKVGKAAKSTTKATASNLSFDQQCKHCEKESINNSLMNLLTYPWVKERVAKGLLSLHGGYYDFVDCTYEKWTLDYLKNIQKQETGGYAIKNREFWS
ncbi:putative carbonic anhydrase [Helianthus annuus]|nr:putative carbonic anhydrase [Helianthus annuus]